MIDRKHGQRLHAEALMSVGIFKSFSLSPALIRSHADVSASGRCVNGHAHSVVYTIEGGGKIGDVMKMGSYNRRVA